MTTNIMEQSIVSVEDEDADLRNLDWLTSFSLPNALPSAHFDNEPNDDNCSTTTSSLSPVSTSETTTTSSRRRVSCTNRQSQCTIGCWIYRTILQSELKALALSDIYKNILKKHPDRDSLSSEWKRSVRHSLSTSQCFARVSSPNVPSARRLSQCPSWWTIHPDYIATYKSSVLTIGPQHRCPPKNGEHNRWSRVKRHASSEYELAQMAQDLSAAAVIFGMNKTTKKIRSKKHADGSCKMKTVGTRTKHLTISNGGGHDGDHCYLEQKKSNTSA